MIAPDDYPGRQPADEDREERLGMLSAFLICLAFWGGILLWLLFY